MLVLKVCLRSPFQGPCGVLRENPTCGIDPAERIFHLDFPRGGIHHHGNEDRGGMPGAEET